MHVANRIIILLMAALCLSAQPMKGELIEGVASVKDGDGLLLTDDYGNETVIRIYGIDAPEAMQPCRRADGTSYRCGRVASAFLEQWVSGHPVACRVEDRDHHKRLVSSCALNGMDIGKEMVSQGYARAYLKYSRRYADTEKAARRESRGFWKGTWDAPWDYRRKVRAGRRG